MLSHSAGRDGFDVAILRALWSTSLLEVVRNDRTDALTARSVGGMWLENAVTAPLRIDRFGRKAWGIVAHDIRLGPDIRGSAVMLSGNGLILSLDDGMTRERSTQVTRE